MTPIWHPSPNFGPRRDGLQPTLVVLHYTAMRDAESALRRLCDPAAEVSAHYLIGKDGCLWQMVREQDRAWHAGAGTWCGMEDINSRSIGIELDNTGVHPFSEPQMATLEELLVPLMNRWAIHAEGVIGHSDMAPGRKIDPGLRFDWQRLERQGLAAPRGTPPAQDPETMDRFRALAQQRGYGTDVPDETLLAATRARYRPWGTGPLDQADLVAVSVGSGQT